MGELALVFWIVVTIVAICWVLLPFALFGIKPLLQQLIAEVRATRQAIERQGRPTP